MLVAVPDPTRPFPLEEVLPLVLEHLRVARRVRVLVALGLHRPLEPDELEPWCGRATAREGFELRQHDAAGPVAVVAEDVGGGIPAVVHPWAAEADRIVTLGLVEPHQYAGFSGGVKTIAIGCAGRATIDALHGLPLLREPGTRIGRIFENPFREALRRVAGVLPPTDGLQLVPPGLEPFAGPAEEAFAHAAGLAERQAFVEWADPVDWLHLPVPEAKAQSFYQASRAATYAALVERAVVRPGGWITIEARCPEGLGSGPGELAFAEALARGPERLLRELRGEEPAEGGSVGGAQRAYVLAQVLREFRIGVVGAPSLEALTSLGIVRFADLTEAQSAIAASGKLRVWPNIFTQIPRLRVAHAGLAG